MRCWPLPAVVWKAVPKYRRPGRSISVSAVPSGPGTDIWRSCRFIGALFRGLRDLPFGLQRFVHYDIGAYHCRLRHIRWERCGHGLTSRPRESDFEDFLNKLLIFSGYPGGSAAALLAGVLPLRYCSARPPCRFPNWKLPDKGHVCELVTDSVVDDRVLGGDGVCRVSFPGSAGGTGVICEGKVLAGFKRIRLNRKTPAHFARLGGPGSVSSRSKFGKRLTVSEAQWCSICGTHVLHECDHSDDGSSLGDRVGVG